MLDICHPIRECLSNVAKQNFEKLLKNSPNITTYNIYLTKMITLDVNVEETQCKSWKELTYSFKDHKLNFAIRDIQQVFPDQVGRNS